jgi:sulfate permease, SulP family
MTRENLRADAVAGLSVALVAIPQSLAYAQLAGLPAYYGLYAALLPTVIGALFGSSAQLSTGPVALTSLLTAASLAPLAMPGSSDYVSLAVALALLSGLLQVAFGVMRLGVMMNLLSQPVLMGFVNAAAILISLSQLPSLLGIEIQSTGHMLRDAVQAVTVLGDAHGRSIAFGLGAIGLLLLLRTHAPRLPGVLITAALLTAASYATDFAGAGGHTVGAIPQGLPAFGLPRLEAAALAALLPAAFAIAIISFMEAMSSAKIAAIRTAQRWDENQELLGQGLAKLAAALSHTMPVSGSFSRSALNLAAGARTGLSSIISAAFVLVTVLFLTPLLHYLPRPVLAAIIIMALVNLVNVRALRNAWRASADDAAAAAVTFAATLAFAPQIQNGIVAGILVSLGLFIFRRMRPDITVIEPGSGLSIPPLEAAAAESVGVVRFGASLVFVNVSYFENAVLRMEQDYPQLRHVLVSAEGINALDASGVEMLRTLSDGLGKKDITLLFAGVKPPVRAVMDRTGLTGQVGEANFFSSEQEARRALSPRLNREAPAIPPA